MAVLGILLVVQSAGLRFIDLSRYVPEVIVNSVFWELAPLVIGRLATAVLILALDPRFASVMDRTAKNVQPDFPISDTSAGRLAKQHDCLNEALRRDQEENH